MLIQAARWVYALVIPLALYAGQTACDVIAERARRKPPRRKPVRKGRKR